MTKLALQYLLADCRALLLNSVRPLSSTVSGPYPQQCQALILNSVKPSCLILSGPDVERIKSLLDNTLKIFAPDACSYLLNFDGQCSHHSRVRVQE
jgi:hypothetical protein